MRVLHIASGDFFSTYGGGQVYVKNVVDEMLRQGVDVCVVSFVGCDLQEITECNYNGARLFEIASADMMADAVRRAKPDIIHAHSMKAPACAIGRELGIPVVVTSHHGGILCPAGTRLDCDDAICHRRVNHKDCLPCVLRNTRTGLRLWYPFMRYLPERTYISLGHKLCKLPFIPFITPIGGAAASIAGKKQDWNNIARDCSVMVAPCREIADAMVLNGLAPRKVRVIPHGIPLPKERPSYPPVVDGRVKFFYVGRICYVKGIHTLLEAFHSVDNPQIELHLIGGAGNKHEARYMSDLQKKYRGDKRVVWHGKIAPEAVYEATRNYHISSSAAFLEAFGLNIAEALALGKPVLATRCGGAEAQITNGVNGWLVPTNDPEALAAKIREIAAHPDRLAGMSDNCQATSIADHCRTLTELYSNL